MVFGSKEYRIKEELSSKGSKVGLIPYGMIVELPAEHHSWEMNILGRFL